MDTCTTRALVPPVKKCSESNLLSPRGLIPDPFVSEALAHRERPKEYWSSAAKVINCPLTWTWFECCGDRDLEQHRSCHPCLWKARHNLSNIVCTGCSAEFAHRYRNLWDLIESKACSYFWTVLKGAATIHECISWGLMLVEIADLSLRTDWQRASN